MLQHRLLWLLSVEVWQEVLGFCSFHEYNRLKSNKLASRDFYFLLKQSLLEMQFFRMMPSPAQPWEDCGWRGVMRGSPLLGSCSCVCVIVVLVHRRKGVPVVSGSPANGGDRAASFDAKGCFWNCVSRR